MLRHFVTGAPVEIAWGPERVLVRTRYGPGKAYAFEIDRDGHVSFLAW